MRGPIPASPLLGTGMKTFLDEKVVSRKNWVGFRLALAEKTPSPHKETEGCSQGCLPRAEPEQLSGFTAGIHIILPSWASLMSQELLNG